MAEVHRLSGPGALDFGGSEFEEAPHEQVAPEKASPDDDYGWWNLGAGAYLLRYNETADLGDDHLAFVFPHERLLQAGASHAAFQISGGRDPLGALLTVGAQGVRIKENARVSRLLLFQTE